MVSKELINKIRQIEVKSNKIVEEIFSGEYRSGFKGKGMEFDDIRQYYHGDDVRNIDWNVTARHNKAFIKQFSEERELNMFLIIDMSKSSEYGDKKDLIAQIGATLALSACKNNDKVGMMLFTDEVEKFIPSKNGRKHVLSIIENILDFSPKLNGTNLSKALQYFNKIEKKRSVVFVISDFLDKGYAKDLNITAKRHDLVMVRVINPTEEIIPKGAIFTFEDLETGEVIALDNLKKEYRLDNNFKKYKGNIINIYTNEDYYRPLKQFFRRRGNR